MIFGIGVDTVDIGRFERSIGRTPKLRSRLFTERERELPMWSLAARFAAKEALIKALGDSHGLAWHDMEILRDEDRAPSFARHAALASELTRLGAGRIHVSMTHDAGVATAFVVVEAAMGLSLAEVTANGDEK